MNRTETEEAADAYCRRFGFDLQGRLARLALLGLGEEDHHWARLLHREVIDPVLSNIVDGFYEHLLRFDEVASMIDGEDEAARLKGTQSQYLMSLGLGFDNAAYFEERLRVGWSHAKRGVALGIYQSAYCRLQCLILDAVPETLQRDRPAYKALAAFLLKITNLDMSLAVEAYHGTQVQGLRRSLDALQDEGAQLREKVSRDWLTGLVNREYVVGELERLVPGALRNGRPLCLMMVDIDHFKRINDEHGHLVGDGVLQEVAHCLRAGVRDFDIVGRFGGEEFIIVLRDALLTTAEEAAERLRREVERRAMVIHGHAIRTTISLGLTELRPRDDALSLVARADAALYEAKEEGRNRIVML